MISLTNPVTGHRISTDDASVEFWTASGYRAEGGTAETKGYDGLKVAELKDEIDRRNEGRDEADLLSTEGKKADLIATLEADDNK